MAVPLQIALLVPLSVACGDLSADTDTSSEPAAAGICGEFGYILPDAVPGDTLSADSPLIRSVVVSNGLLSLHSPPPSWQATVAELHGPGPLVVAFRDAQHAVICPGLN
jgi:hypothetical protein